MDAGIAMAAMLGVVDPAMTGIGGDLILLYYDSREGTVSCLNASGPAPHEATPERIRAAGYTKMPTHSCPN
jgi:gamma-glutamyltranspeptidase/glutathione hydrolase